MGVVDAIRRNQKVMHGSWVEQVRASAEREGETMGESGKRPTAADCRRRQCRRRRSRRRRRCRDFTDGKKNSREPHEIKEKNVLCVSFSLCPVVVFVWFYFSNLCQSAFLLFLLLGCFSSLHSALVFNDLKSESDKWKRRLISNPFRPPTLPM